MRNFQCLAQGLNITPLLAALVRKPELWHEDTYMRDYPQGPFGETDSILLRFPVKSVKQTEEEVKDHLSKYDQQECIDFPPFKVLPEARPLVFGLMSLVQGERLGRVIINRILPGGVIFPHVDRKEHTDYYTRYHIPLKTQPGVVFRAGDEKVFMAPGELWWFDNSQEHEVLNNSSDDRIHMVIDVRTSR